MCGNTHIRWSVPILNRESQIRTAVECLRLEGMVCKIIECCWVRNRDSASAWETITQFLRSMRGSIEEGAQIFTEPIKIKWFLNTIVTSRGQSSDVIAWSAPRIERQNLDLIAGVVFTNAASGFEPIEKRQATVHQNHLRPFPRCCLDGLWPVTGFHCSTAPHL